MNRPRGWPNPSRAVGRGIGPCYWELNGLSVWPPRPSPMPTGLAWAASAARGERCVRGVTDHVRGRPGGRLSLQREREQLVGVGFGDEWSCECARAVGKRAVCGGWFHDGGWQRGQLYR